MSGPYAEGAPHYWGAGWRSVLPLPPKRKANPPDDYTGWKGTLVPSWPDVMSWIETRGDGNICLRLPLGVLGIDVDDYDGKVGGQTFAALIARYGELPSTWMSTSRDGVSGIRLFRVPVLRGEGGEAKSLAWPGKIGPGIESIHYGHRYMLVSPSIHDKTGQTYRWYTPDGTPSPSSAPPRITDLPELPTAWVVGLTQGREAHTYQGAGMDDAEIKAWLEAHWGGVPCTPMSDTADELLDELHDGAHESLRLLMRLVGMAAVGHAGLREVLGTVRKKFIAEVTSRRDDEMTAAEEWTRSLFGAVDKVLGEMAKTGTVTSTVDPCEVFDEVLVSPAPSAHPNPLTDIQSQPPPGSDEQPSDEYQPRELNDEEIAAAREAREQRELDDELRNLRRREKARQILAAESAPRFRPLGFGEFKLGPEPEPIVPGMLYRDSLARVFGAPGCGKSFLALDLAFSVALGRDWVGDPVKQTPVAYVMAEGQRVNKLRAEAWQERHGVTDDELEGHFYAIPDALALTEAAVGPFVAWVREQGIGLVVLDTKNAMQVGEENSATDAAIMRRALDMIRKATDACVVLIDHTGKTDIEEARGSSAVKAAMDTEIKVDNDGKSPAKVTVTVSRDKAAEAGRQWELMLRMAGRAAVLLPLGEDVDLPAPRPLPGEVERAWMNVDRMLPEAVVGYEGPGKAAVPDLAKFMAHDAGAADPDGIGVTQAQAKAALSVRTLGKTLGHSEAAVRRAWSALRAMGYLAPADGKDGSDGKVENTTGRHVWTARAGA